LTIALETSMLRLVDAFEELAPVSNEYAHLPVTDAFDWSGVGAQLGTGEWYLVVFRSLRRGECDEGRLFEIDERAHLEAAGSPGFVFYYKGPLAVDRTCLSFCMWTSRAAARAAAGRPEHVTAVSVLNEMYERYTLEFLRVTGTPGGALEFEPFDRPVIDPEAPRAA
jgi:hypothetical protein